MFLLLMEIPGILVTRLDYVWDNNTPKGSLQLGERPL
jgi:hypothetical protein